MLKVTAKSKNRTINLEKKLKAFSELMKAPSKVRVGIPDNSITYPDGTPLLLVAATQEFGNSDLGIPERSFLRTTVVENKKDVKMFWQKEAKRLLMGNTSSEKSLDILGQMIEGKVKQKIIDLKTPPNAPSTIRKKGSSNPLISSALLLGSIRYKVDK